MVLFGQSIATFYQKTLVFRRKLAKIAENCDHNIGPLEQHPIGGQ
jgi:hypothetical protein